MGKVQLEKMGLTTDSQVVNLWWFIYILLQMYFHTECFVAQLHCFVCCDPRGPSPAHTGTMN